MLAALTAAAARASRTLTAAPLQGWPSRCAVCRGWGRSALCTDCIDRFATPLPRCQRCGVALAVAAPACGACLADPPPFERTVCAIEYGFPWQGLITRFKFEGAVDLARPLAERLTAAVRATSIEWPDCVVPVPLSRSRLAERGFNQAWELARRVARQLDIPALANAVLRAVDTPHQAGLERQARLSNLRGAFTAAAPYRDRLAGGHVALVDDVMTTGATVAAAAAALQRAGVARVEVWVLARTPAPAGANIDNDTDTDTDTDTDNV